MCSCPNLCEVKEEEEKEEEEEEKDYSGTEYEDGQYKTTSGQSLVISIPPRMGF